MANTKNDMKAEATITFQIISSNPFDHRKKREVLERFARLDMDRQAKLEALVANEELDQAIVKLPTDDCARLKEIAGNSKALKKLKDNWAMLKTMILG